MSVIAIVLLALAAVLLAAAEWPRLAGLAGRLRRGQDAPPTASPQPGETWLEPEDRLGRQRRERARQDADEFAASVRKDLDSLPTLGEDEAHRR